MRETPVAIAVTAHAFMTFVMPLLVIACCQWYRAGADVQKLSCRCWRPTSATKTFLYPLGFYLTATPELLTEASRRFHDAFGSVVLLPEEFDDIC